MLIVPMNVGRTHCVLIVVDFRSQTVESFDSMGGAYNDVMQNVLQYIDEDMQNKKAGPLLKNRSGNWLRTREMSPSKVTLTMTVYLCPCLRSFSPVVPR